MIAVLAALTLATIGFLVSGLMAHAAGNKYVHVATTSHGVQVQMDLPANYSGAVATTCVNGKCHTTSTTTPLTKADVAQMNTQLKTEEATMKRLWAEQQQLFQKQAKLFQQLFNTTWW